MATYEQSITVAVPPSRLYAYLSDVDNLPEYMPRVTQAHAVDDGEAVAVTAEIDPEGGEPQTVHGEAWLRVREEGRSLEWGSQGPNDYSGELEVDPGDGGGSTLTVRLHTERTEGAQVDGALREVVDQVKQLVEREGVA
jgi:uncharacterized protein YndB with AHSA1/START domain